jgi:DNA-binding response OmpR family regulator
VVEGIELDAVVSDVGMPGEDGYCLAQKLRARPGFDVPILALTGFASPADRSAAASAGFDDNLAKPVSPDTLVTKVRQLVRSRRARASVPLIGRA